MSVRLLKRFSLWALIAALGFLTGVVVLYVLWVRSGPAVELWHTVELTEEFRADQAGRLNGFHDYQALEDRLFDELRSKVYALTPTGPEQVLNRFSSGSAADPEERSQNWNRSFELAPEDPVGGVLLLHGMSDSPYSLRAIGQALADRGYRVLGLRMPGHGTAPAGLLSVTWEDMAAATRIGMAHLGEELEGRPLHMIGYSTGAALALDYALTAMAAQGIEAVRSTQVPASLVLVSPAIGITPAAAATPWLIRLSRIPGLEQVAWTTLLPEFDPFNYNAFSANASLQVHRMTRSTTARVRELSANGPIRDFPATLVLLSVVDATVSPEAAVDNLLGRLAPGRHGLLLYDINRRAVTSTLLISERAALAERLLEDPTLPFELTLITNAGPDTREVVALRKPPLSTEPTRTDKIPEPWPADALSLSHVDLPFPIDDPLYGRYPPPDTDQVFLGQLAIRGERGVFKVPAQWLLRLRHNPFYDYQAQRMLDWIGAANGAQPPPRGAPTAKAD
ncbi:MAG: alpha/beta fold hydrolase [Gammaproteobacteria bacterium]|jgi:alpha-beta hydrolase superfamily lysophospholipase|nr:alpha/beta fold hydrolase [Gammaproteobacteria bacterium]